MAEKKPITYEQIVKKVRKTFENADAREVFEHVAIEVDIVGEGAGATQKMGVREAWHKGEIKYEGNEVKFNLILDKVKLKK